MRGKKLCNISIDCRFINTFLLDILVVYWIPWNDGTISTVHIHLPRYIPMSYRFLRYRYRYRYTFSIIVPKRMDIKSQEFSFIMRSAYNTSAVGQVPCTVRVILVWTASVFRPAEADRVKISVSRD